MISVTITADELIARGACGDGLARFVADFPEGLRVVDWTQQHAVWWAAWRDCALTISDRSWAVEEGLVPRANLAGANLAGANLSGANLDGAYYPSGDLPEGWDRVNGYLMRRSA